jgi:hypothetical protein
MTSSEVIRSEQVEPGKIVLASPLYTHVSVNWLTRYLELDRTHVAATLIVRKMYLVSAMQKLFSDAQALADDWTRIIIYEADMIPPRDAVNRIAHYPDEIDIVGSAYFGHSAPYTPMVYGQVDERHYQAWHHSSLDPKINPPGLYPADGVGFGFTSIHRRVLEKWDHDRIPMFGNELQMGHDLAFCTGARAQGFSVWCDTAIHCGHLTENITTIDDARRYTQEAQSIQAKEQAHG